MNKYGKLKLIKIISQLVVYIIYIVGDIKIKKVNFYGIKNFKEMKFQILIL